MCFSNEVQEHSWKYGVISVLYHSNKVLNVYIECPFHIVKVQKLASYKTCAHAQSEQKCSVHSVQEDDAHRKVCICVYAIAVTKYKQYMFNNNPRVDQ